MDAARQTTPSRLHAVFPSEHARSLDSGLRRFLYRPDRLAAEFVHYGERVLDFGCGPGFFTRSFARRVGEQGEVIAADLQEEMLRILRERLEPEGLMPRIRVHRCMPDSIGLPPGMNGQIDVAFALLVVHEVPDPGHLFCELFALLRPGGVLFLAEPPIIVSASGFRDTLRLAEGAGFRMEEKRWLFVNRAAVLKKDGMKP